MYSKYTGVCYSIIGSDTDYNGWVYGGLTNSGILNAYSGRENVNAKYYEPLFVQTLR